jgi:hypothetical protein
MVTAPGIVGDFEPQNVDEAVTQGDATVVQNAYEMMTAVHHRDAVKTVNEMTTWTVKLTANVMLIANVTTTRNVMLTANVSNYVTAIRANAYRDEIRCSRRTDNCNFEATELIELRFLSGCHIGVDFPNGCCNFCSHCRWNINDVCCHTWHHSHVAGICNELFWRLKGSTFGTKGVEMQTSPRDVVIQ